MSVPIILTASTEAELDQAIATVDAASSGTYEIDITATIDESADLTAFNLANGVAVTINGETNTIDGGGAYQGLFVYAGDVTVENLTLANNAAIGGNGGGGGGGGAGLGGGLFIGSGGVVTLDNVDFSGDSATGGNGTSTPGLFSGGGGGGGIGGAGDGIPTRGGGGTAGSGAAGGDGQAGNGGGIGGGAAAGGDGGKGGFGGGGGGGFSKGGGGGFGGGGGGGYTDGGNGGFGGGGGSGLNAGTGGFGGGKGGVTTGGGGLGAGGDIFVQQGGVLDIAGGVLGAGSVSGGSTSGTLVNSPAQHGSGDGNAIFLQGNETENFVPALGSTVTVDGEIADQTGSGGTGSNAGSGTVSVHGQGTVILNATDTFTGGILLQSGTLELGAVGAAGSGDINFDNVSGKATLDFSVADAPSVAITGFAAGDSVLVSDLSINGIQQSVSGDVLTLTGLDTTTNTDTSLSLTFSGYAGTFGLIADGSGLAIEVACYCPGTLIATQTGDMPIEALAIGDQVRTISGALRPIRWIGRRAYAASFAARNKAVWPVRIAAGALADGVPARALSVSPNHALYIDGVLIDAAHLINGVTITCDEPTQDVAYLNIEFDSHEVVLAEGAPAESFLDRDCRAMFSNASEYAVLYPEAKPAAAPIFYARRVEDGPSLDAIRRRIAARAGIVEGQGGQPGPLIGALDKLDQDGITGWAVDSANPGQPVTLEVIVDGTVVAQLLANHRRDDLATLGNGSARYAFDLRWEKPLAHNTHHVVTVRRVQDGAVLPGAPVLLGAMPSLADVAPALRAIKADEAASLLLGAIDQLLTEQAAVSGQAAQRTTRFWTTPDTQVA